MEYSAAEDWAQSLAAELSLEGQSSNLATWESEAGGLKVQGLPEQSKFQASLSSLVRPSK